MKPKLILVSLIFALTSLISFVFYRQSDPSLLSPLIYQKKPPDLSSKLQDRLSQPPPLNYQQLSTPPKIPPHISYLLYQPQTGLVYAIHDLNTRLAPASFTKLMTAIIALDIASPWQLLTASAKSIDKEPTTLGLKAGEQLTLLELIQAAVTTSANDAAATLAEGSAAIYNQPPAFFVNLMNQKAAYMNMNNTRFANPEGYDDHYQYSTLEDLYILIHNVQQNYPDIIQAGATNNDDLQATSTHGFYYLPNWNTLLDSYPGVTGLKIAYTGNAGYSAIITSTREGYSVNLILFGGASISERDLLAASLLDFAYQTHGLKPVRLTQKDLQPRYDQWRELANQIKIKIDQLEASSSSSQP